MSHVLFGTTVLTAVVAGMVVAATTVLFVVYLRAEGPAGHQTGTDRSGGGGLCGDATTVGLTARNRARRRLFVTTETLEIAMAAPASIGLRSPAAARGMRSRL